MRVKQHSWVVATGLELVDLKPTDCKWEKKLNGMKGEAIDTVESTEQGGEEDWPLAHRQQRDKGIICKETHWTREKDKNLIHKQTTKMKEKEMMTVLIKNFV